jgi:hypothetical protein
MDGVLFKIDFKKAYDKVKWSFLQQALRMKGFPPKWCNWIGRFIQGGSVRIKVNDDIGNYFQTLKGLRQGDPLSPILFNIVADMLAILIARAKEDGQIGSLVPIWWMVGFLFYNMLMIPYCLWSTIWKKS